MDGMKIKPFPWRCPECRQKTVWMVRRDYKTSAQHDGVLYELTVRDADVPTCSHCGQSRIIISQLSEQISDELRRAAGLLSPQEIRERRDALGISGSELAAALRISGDTFARWENGGQLQPRALDLLLRLFLDSADVRRVCVANSSAQQELPTPA
jgi:putative zinc finger/helix-turn-helix YgiT family protein